MDFIKSPKSAIVVIPKVSNKLLLSIQDIRRENDKAYERWMPHVNLIFPFIERPNDDFGQEVAMIRKSFEECNVRRFQMKFCDQSVGFFEMKKNFTIWLKPLPLSVPEMMSSTVAVPETIQVQLEKKLTQNEEAIQKNKKKQSTDNEWVEKYCVDPFGTFDEHAMDVSLFDLHSEGDHLYTYGASLFNFSKKKYATWGYRGTNQVRNRTKPKENMPVRSRTPGELDFQLIEESETSLQDYLDERFEDHDLLCVKNLPDLMRLQASLRRAFPKCDDLDTISSSGFQPHLTLGQFKKRNIDTVVQTIQKDLFKGAEEFTIDSIHIITRHSYDDKFEVRHTVDLM